MSIFAGNLASKITLSLQFRASSVQWVKRNIVIMCIKGREFNSSSVPVRYIPKRSSKSDEMENSLPMKDNEKRVFGKNSDGIRGKIGLNDKTESRTGSEKRIFENPLPMKSYEKRVFENKLDDIMGDFGLNEKAKNRKQICNEILSFDDARLVKQNTQEVTEFSQLEEKINHESRPRSHKLMGEPEEDVEERAMQQEKDISNQSLMVRKIMPDAERVAVGLLAKRAYTAVELRKKLQGKRFTPDIVEAVISDFQSRGLINDGLYAETFSRSRWSSSSWGPRRIKKALSNKGVSEADTEKALELVFEDGDSDQQESKVGLSKISMDHLLVQASKQWLRGQDVSKDTRKSRLIRWLQYRGFSWDVVNFVLKKLESQHTS